MNDALRSGSVHLHPGVPRSRSGRSRTQGAGRRTGDGSGIRQVDGRDRDAGEIGDARALDIGESCSRRFGTRSTTRGPTTRASGCRCSIRSRRVGAGYLIAVLVAIPLGFPDRHVAVACALDPSSRS